MDHPETLPEKATAPPSRQQRGQAEAAELREGWRRLGRAATIVAIITSPAVFVWFDSVLGWSALASLAAAIVTVIIFRGFFDVVTRWMIPWPSTFGIADPETLQNEVVARRRLWWWRSFFKLWVWLILIGILAYLVGSLLWNALGTQTQSYLLASLPSYAISLPMLFLVNILILFGPFLAMSISQIKAYEPGDADWGVRLDDVRGQAEAKEEVRRVVSLWESGDQFEKAGGKRERGLLMLGAPGTGKTMLSKAVATGFNCPFVSIPGSGFAGMFIGMDILTVRYLAWKAKRLARKWGGQCIVFIDEIDAVGQRRSSLGTSMTADPVGIPSIHDFCFYGPDGALTSSGDLVIETREWRDRLFAARAERERAPSAAFMARVTGTVDRIVAPGGMFGQGSGALNSLLVVMDGLGGPPFWRRFWVNRLNTWMDASYIVPQKIGSMPLRLRRPKPANEQIYFIGACNAPIESLDPALTRPGRMGRHVWFRTPTKDDRQDIFDLYLGKVAHEAELDEARRRDELARITNGYSPAMIEQVCSMALTVAHHEGRPEFGWYDLVEAMTTIETGTAVNVEYVPAETRAVAIHEAGHAVASHVYAKRLEATRLTIRMRGSSMGHYYALEKEERFTSWRHEKVARLIQTLGAMAAEHVFYGENSDGVGGDVQSVTATAAIMVGASAMAPEQPDLDGVILDDERAEELRKKIMKRYETIGTRIMQRASFGSAFTADPISQVLGDPGKRRMVAELLGQAYVAAYATIVANRDAVEHIADVLVERREIYGDEVLSLLEECNLQKPTFDELDEASWPKV